MHIVQTLLLLVRCNIHTFSETNTPTNQVLSASAGAETSITANLVRRTHATWHRLHPAQLQGFRWRRTAQQQPLSHPCASLTHQPTPQRVLELRDGVVEMFDHAYRNYMQHAFPKVAFMLTSHHMAHCLAYVNRVQQCTPVCMLSFSFPSPVTG